MILLISSVIAIVMAAVALRYFNRHTERVALQPIRIEEHPRRGDRRQR